jgi:hypothetical protein
MAKTTNKSFVPSSDKPLALTPVEYSGLQAAYDHFNAALFDGALLDVFITYQRKANSLGHFSPDRFAGRIEKFGRHELALNPDAFIAQTDEQVLQTLVHEMTHVWQHHCGTPPARGYHNKEWAAKMKSIGLMPSSTGMVGGKETGARMSDYIIPGGAFSNAYTKLAAIGWKLNLQSAPRLGPKVTTKDSKTPFTCPACRETNAWGKPDLGIVCERCLVGRLQAAGIDLGIINGLRLQDKRVLIVETPAVFDVPTSYQLLPEPEPVPPKRGGRPKGSKNKPKAPVRSYHGKLPRKLKPKHKPIAVGCV